MKFSGKFLVLTCLLLAVEVLIALFVRDAFVRPFVGDLLVVVLIYSFLRIFLSTQSPRLVVGVCAFAFGVEFLQYFDPVGLLGWENNRFLSVLIGRTFSWLDLLAYLAGSVVNQILSKWER